MEALSNCVFGGGYKQTFGRGYKQLHFRFFCEKVTCRPAAVTLQSNEEGNDLREEEARARSAVALQSDQVARAQPGLGHSHSLTPVLSCLARVGGSVFG